ncbi:MAG: LCP family protein [Oscillospiraceae bacterium]
MRMQKPKQKKLKVGFIFVFIILIVLVLGGLYFAQIVSELNHNDLDKDKLGIAVPVKDDPNDQSITNIALFGVDRRNDQKDVHSDVIMVMSIDKKHNKIKLSSIMRDTAVEIEGHGQDKITKAYFYGGPELAVKTINQNFNLDIAEYATVDFKQTATIINAVGGVEINISEEERLDANNSIYEQAAVAGLPQDIIKEAGLQILSGTQAVAYARIRHVGNSDFERTDRQREVLEKMFHKAITMNKLQYPEFARKMLPAIETSLDIGEILGLSSIMLRDVSFEDLRFPMNSELIGDGSILISKNNEALNVDLKSMTEHMRQFIYDDIKPEK